MLGAAAIGGGTSLLCGYLGSSGAKDAASTQAQSGREALAFQKQVYGDTQANLRPFIDQGRGAMSSAASAIGGLAPYTGLGAGAASQLGGLYGMGGANGGKPDYSAFTNSPDYNFAFSQGRDATSNVLGASGTLRGGAGLASLTNFGQGLASQQYGNYFSRLMGMAGMGQQAAGQQSSLWSGLAGMGINAASGAANFAGNMSGQIGNTIGGIGQANASGTVGSANAWSGGLTGAANAATGAANNYAQYNLLQGLQNRAPQSGYAGGSPESNPLLNPASYGNLSGPAIG